VWKKVTTSGVMIWIAGFLTDILWNTGSQKVKKKREASAYKQWV